MSKAKILLVLASVLLIAIAFSGCKYIISGTFVIVENIEFTAGSGFYFYQVDITDEEDWDEHKDDIDFIDAVGVEFGFHEDYFPSFTGEDIYGFPDADDSGDWSMYYCFENVTPASTNNWLSSPISGESPMNSQKNAWADDFDDIMTVLRDYHFSFLGPAGGHQSDGNQTKFNEMKRALGYNLHIERCDWPDVIDTGIPFEVTLVMTNSGSAPCYHDFPVEMALCDANGTPVWKKKFAFDLRKVVPGKLHRFREFFSVNGVADGEYSLRIGVVDPRLGRPGVRLQSAGEDANLRYRMGSIKVRGGGTVVSLGYIFLLLPGVELFR